jgi:hypothetical protein
MREISSGTLAVLVLVALLVGVASLLVRFDTFGLTGRASSDTGNVTLTIVGSVHIQVDPGNFTINFGTCTPRASPYSCSSNDTLQCDGASDSNCTGDTVTPQFIRVENVGSLNASVNVTSACTAATLIGGTSPALNFLTTGCDGTGVSSWTALGTQTLACSDIITSTGAFHLFANVTIPNDATGANSGCTGTSTLTFTAIAS